MKRSSREVGTFLFLCHSQQMTAKGRVHVEKKTAWVYQQTA